MDKFKSFVIKYQLWFKLAACILLVCMIFTPTIHQTILNTPFTSVWSFIWYHHRWGLTFNREYVFYFYCYYAFVIITIALIVLLLVSIFQKKIFALCQFLYILDFIVYILGAVFMFYNSPSIPHIAFYLALLLLVADIICTVFWIKSHKPSPSKDERIAELEKRIEELESQTADKNKSTNIEKSNEKDGE